MLLPMPRNESCDEAANDCSAADPPPTTCDASGTTIITHGFQLLAGEVPSWVFRLAEAVLERATGGPQCGGSAPPNPVGTVLRYIPETFIDASGTHRTGTWEYHCGATQPNGPIVLVFDWASESDLNGGGAEGMSEAAADALYAALRDARFVDAAFSGVDPLEADVHFIGHSRGTVVHSETVERLSLAGLAVDHLTTLDPHPVNGTLADEQALPIPPDFGDSVPQVWTRVTFADNYHRADGGTDTQPSRVHSVDFDGISMSDADVDVAIDCDIFDLGVANESNDLDAALADINVLALDHEHVKVHAWYYGTVLIGATIDGAGTTIDPAGDVSWYYDAATHSCVPADDATGYGYALLAKDETRPASGSRATPGTAGGPAAQFSPTTIYNGDFETVDLVVLGHAGWRYQGGSMTGVTPWLLEPSGNLYHNLNTANTPLTHNWMYLDPSVSSLRIDLRVTLPSAGQLQIHLVDENGNSVQTLGSETIANPHGWMQFAFPVPATVRGASHRLELRFLGAGSVDVDNLAFTSTQATPSLGVSQLVLVALLLLAGGAWGATRRAG